MYAKKSPYNKVKKSDSGVFPTATKSDTTRQLEEELSNERRRIQDLMHDMGNTINTVSIDLHCLKSRNPALLESSSEVQDIVANMESALARAARYIRNESGSGETMPGTLKLSNFNISDLIHQLSRTFRNIFIELQPDIVIEGDGAKIERLLSNVIGNAIKFTNNPNSPVNISAEIEKNQIKMYVRDWGPGIAEDDADKIFERGYRGSNISEDIEGTGIGLDICRQICDHHDGSISVQNNKDGIGCTFTITLPLKQS